MQLTPTTMRQTGGIGKDGNFIRNSTAYRGGLDGDDDGDHDSGDDGNAGNPVATADLALIANGGCPWAHRTIVARALLGLEAAVPLLGTQTAFRGLFAVPSVSTMGWQLEDPLPDSVCDRSEALAKLRAREVRAA